MIGTRFYKPLEGDSLKFYAKASLWANDNNATIDEMGDYYEVVARPEPSLEEQVQAAYASLDSNVEKRLNDFAATRRYASIYTACNARDSQIEKYAAEGAYCFKMWGETYAKCEELVAEYMPAVLAGERPIPSWEEIEAQLPPLVWPDEA